MASILNVDKIRANGSTTDAIVIDSDNYADISGQELDIWHLDSNITTTGVTNAVITTVSRFTQNWEKIGTGMTESAGIFTFPSTGKWEIQAKYYYKGTANNNYAGGYIQLSTDSGSTYNTRGQGYNHAVGNNDHNGINVFAYIDVTNTSTMKVRFFYEVGGTAVLYGDSTNLRTAFIFKKIAST